MFYMIDKLGVDSSKRLSGMYDTATETSPFPIKADALGYELCEGCDLSDGKRIYNAGATCIDNADAPDPMKQLKHIWEQTVLMGIGPERNVNAERIIFLFDGYFNNNACVYPAQSFEEGWKFKDKDFTDEEFWKQTQDSSNGYYIERNADDYFGSSGDDDTNWNDRYITFWTKH